MNVTRKLYLRETGRNPGTMLNKLTKLESWAEMDKISDTPSYACKFCLKDGSNSLLAIAYEGGDVGIGDTESRSGEVVTDGCSMKAMKKVRVHRNAVFDVAWLPTTTQLVTASGDETSQLLDIGRGSINYVQTYAAHSASVRRVDANPCSDQEFVTCGRDGRIFMWDKRCDKYSDFIDRCHHVGTKSSNPAVCAVLDVKYLDNHLIVSCGNADGAMKMWDLRKTHCYRSAANPCRTIRVPVRNRIFCEIAVAPGGNSFYATCTYGQLLRYSRWEFGPRAVYTGRKVELFGRFCVSPDGDHLCVATEDNFTTIWPTSTSKTALIWPLGSMTAHTSTVTSMAWSHQREPLIVTSSDDLSHRIWKVPQLLSNSSLNYQNLGNFETENDIARLPIESRTFPSDELYHLIEHMTKSIPMTLSPSVAKPHLSITPRKDLTDCGKAEVMSAPRQALSPVESDPETTPHPPRVLFRDHPTSYFLKNLPNSAVEPGSVESPGPASSVKSPPLKENFDWLTEWGRSRPSPVSAPSRSAERRSSGKKRPSSVSAPSRSAERRSSGKKRGALARTPSYKFKGKSLLKYFHRERKMTDNEGAKSDSSD